MKNTRRTESISLGDLVALVFDAAEGVSPDPRLATTLAALTVNDLVRDSRRRRVTAPERCAA